jgi:hypothetical protein
MSKGTLNPMDVIVFSCRLLVNVTIGIPISIHEKP